MCYNVGSVLLSPEVLLQEVWDGPQESGLAANSLGYFDVRSERTSADKHWSSGKSTGQEPANVTLDIYLTESVSLSVKWEHAPHTELAGVPWVLL